MMSHLRRFSDIGNRRISRTEENSPKCLFVYNNLCRMQISCLIDFSYYFKRLWLAVRQAALKSQILAGRQSDRVTSYPALLGTASEYNKMSVSRPGPLSRTKYVDYALFQKVRSKISLQHQQIMCSTISIELVNFWCRRNFEIWIANRFLVKGKRWLRCAWSNRMFWYYCLDDDVGLLNVSAYHRVTSV